MRLWAVTIQGFSYILMVTSSSGKTSAAGPMIDMARFWVDEVLGLSWTDEGLYGQRPLCSWQVLGPAVSGPHNCT